MNNGPSQLFPQSPQEHRSVSTLGSVWLTGTQSLGAQLADRGYHRTTGSDSALMPPAIAAHAIATLTCPGDVVLDPDCGAGTTIVAALHAGRHAIGLTAHRRWWQLARTNVTATKARGAFVDGMVLILDRRPGTVVAAETAGLTGRVDLLLTTLRSPDPSDGLNRLCTLLTESRQLVRPGGHVVVTTAPQRHPTRLDLLDLPSQILAAGSAAGFAPITRCVALTADLRRRRVLTHASFAQRRTATHIERATGHPSALPAHHTALVFRADPDAADAVLAQPIPALPPLPRRRLRRSKFNVLAA
jgi:modification methylase